MDETQIELATKLDIPENPSYKNTDGKIVFTLDVQYNEMFGYIACDVKKLPNILINVYLGKVTVSTSYEPQYFAFHEGPLLNNHIDEIIKRTGIKPDFILVDGHGVAHPRGFGLACLVGLYQDTATIGCAKRSLLKYDGQLGNQKGDTLDVYLNRKIVGKVVRTQPNIKPVYVSVGNKIHLSDALNIILKLTGEFRQIEPIRRADQYARSYSKGIQ